MGLAAWVRRAGMVTAVVVTGWILAALPASANPESEVQGSQAPPWLTWIQLEDTRGISIWLYELSIDRGGITSPGKFFWSAITDFCWSIYRAVCAVALWFLDWVLSFTWVTTLASPLLAVGDALQAVVNTIGVIPTLLTLAAIAAVVWMARGKWATGIWELAMTLVIAALATGVFAQPVHMIAGPDGVIVQTNQAGQELAAELATGEAAGKTPEELRQEQTGQMVDTFIRQPTQLINFGRVVDGGDCEAAFNEVVAAGPYGDDPDIRDRMGDCDERLKDYANEPTVAMAGGSLMVMPAAFVILFLAVIMAGAVVAAGCWAMYQSVKAIITLVLGLLPGGGRGSFLLTVSETLVSLLIILFTSVFLGVFLLVIQAVFAGASGESLGKTFFIVDIIIIVGVIVYWRQRNAIKAASARLAAMMAKRPGGAQATKLPERAPGISMAPVRSAVQTATNLGHLRAQRRAARAPAPGPQFVDARQQVAFIGMTPRRQDPGPPPHYNVVPDPNPGPPRPGSTGPAGRLPGGGGTSGALPPGNSTPPQNTPSGQSPGNSTPPQNSTPSGQSPGKGTVTQRTKKVAGTLAKAGTQVALGAATGGTGNAATAAAKAGKVVSNARRAALTARMARSTGGHREPVQPMKPRTQPAPSPGRGQARTPEASRAVVTGEVVATKLAGSRQQDKKGKTDSATTGRVTPKTGNPPKTRRTSGSPRQSTTPRPQAPPSTHPQSGETTPGRSPSKGDRQRDVTDLKVAHAASRTPAAEREEPRPGQDAADRLNERLSQRSRRRRALTGRGA